MRFRGEDGAGELQPQGGSRRRSGQQPTRKVKDREGVPEVHELRTTCRSDWTLTGQEVNLGSNSGLVGWSFQQPLWEQASYAP